MLHVFGTERVAAGLGRQGDGCFISMKSLDFYRTTDVSELVIAIGLPALMT